MLGNGIEVFGLRDDAATLGVPGGGPLVVSVDSVVEGVHVDLSVCSPGDVGWKALMGALSDLAAMGAAPLGALVALCVPGGSGQGDTGARRDGRRGGGGGGERVPGGGRRRVGGGAAGGGGHGAGDGRGRRGSPWRARGRSPGDVVLVTGPCGGSAAGLRELRAGSPRAARRLPPSGGAPARGRGGPAAAARTP